MLREVNQTECLEGAPGEPLQVPDYVEQQSLRSRRVVDGVSLQNLVSSLPVEQSVNNDRTSRVDNIVKLVVDGFVQGLSRIPISDAKPKLRDTQNNVFEKVVKNQS